MNLWRNQIAAILRLELKKTFFSPRGWWVYLLALAPVALAGLHSALVRGHCTVAGDNMVFAGVFQIFYLRLGIFFGCVGIFANLFRSEMLEKTMHYYFLSPVRREVLMAGKYLAGLAVAAVLFSGSVVVSFLLLPSHFGSEYWDFVLHGPGGAQLGWYFVVTILACIGYGAAFMVAGLFVRNPLIPAACVWVWEGINPFLPTLLKRFSVIYYLKSLCPVEIPARHSGLLEMLVVASDPVARWLAITGLLAVSALVLAAAALRARRVEIKYGD